MKKLILFVGASLSLSINAQPGSSVANDLAERAKDCLVKEDDVAKLDEVARTKYESETCLKFRRTIEALQKGQRPGPLPDPSIEQKPSLTNPGAVRDPGLIKEIDKNSGTIKER